MANPQKLKAIVKDINSYGNHVYKVIFSLEKKFPRFKAGQFLHLTVDEFDPSTGFWPESRVFSIASCSEDRKKVSIVYSVKGSYTKKMEKTLAVGSEVWLKAPYGDFIIKNHVQEGQTVVLIAGGTGVSPFIPFLMNNESTTNIILNYGLRNSGLIIFEEELKSVLESGKLHLGLYLEENIKEIPLKGNVFIQNGRLSIETILEDIKDVQKGVFFISGPPEMITLFQTRLIENGIEENRIIIDQWG